MNPADIATALSRMLAAPPNVGPADIIAMRLAAGLTQRALAVHLNVSTRTVQHWEAGTRRPPMSAMIILSLLAAKL